MKKLFALAAIVFLSGAFANAAEDKGTEFKFGGELRERYQYDNNDTFLNSAGDVDSFFLQRNMFHVNAIASERLQAYFNVLQYSIWGASGSVPTIGSPFATAGGGKPSVSAATNMNALMMEEAWLWWKANDMLSIKAGRMTAEYGDGLILAKNDWLAVPYNFDGLMGRLSWDFLDLDLGGAKLGDLGVVSPTTPNNVTTSAPGANTDTDTELNIYALYASVKNMPDVLKTVDLAVIQIQGDAGMGTAVPANLVGFAPGFATGSSTGNNGGAFGLTTIALHLKGEAAMVDYRADGAWQTGKQKGTAGWNSGQDVTFAGQMYDVEVGVNFPEFMKARLFVDYHTDSGNDKAVGGTSVDMTKNDQYQPLFYDNHKYGGGYMDFFGWGNFTNINIGLHVQPDENATYGVEVNLASRTTTSASYTPRSYLLNNAFIGTTTTNTTDSVLGTEVDLFAKHNYGHGLSSVLQLGYLTLGNYFKNTTAGAGTALNIGSAWQGVAQIQYNF